MESMNVSYSDAMTMPTSERHYHLMKKLNRKIKEDEEAEAQKATQETVTGKGKKVVKTQF